MQAQSVLTSVLKNDNLKTKKKERRKKKGKEICIIRYCLWKEWEGAGSRLRQKRDSLPPHVCSSGDHVPSSSLREPFVLLL